MLDSFSTTEKALGGAAIGLIVGGITLGILLFAFSGKKGYEYYKLNKNKTRSVIKDNPMYSSEMEQKSANPFYEGE